MAEAKATVRAAQEYHRLVIEGEHPLTAALALRERYGVSLETLAYLVCPWLHNRGVGRN